MSKSVEAVLVEALELEPTERADLAAELIATLDGPPGCDVEAVWAAELERRVAAIDAGSVKLEPWSDVRRRIEQEILHN
jgi:putative addiction module component (TIGR02574 family)